MVLVVVSMLAHINLLLGSTTTSYVSVRSILLSQLSDGGAEIEEFAEGIDVALRLVHVHCYRHRQNAPQMI